MKHLKKQHNTEYVHTNQDQREFLWPLTMLGALNPLCNIRCSISRCREPFNWPYNIYHSWPCDENLLRMSPDAVGSVVVLSGSLEPDAIKPWPPPWHWPIWHRKMSILHNIARNTADFRWFTLSETTCNLQKVFCTIPLPYWHKHEMGSLYMALWGERARGEYSWTFPFLDFPTIHLICSTFITLLPWLPVNIYCRY